MTPPSRARSRAAMLLVLVLALLSVGSPAEADAGPWVWPLGGAHAVSRPFDPPAQRYGIGHRGADLPSAPGQPVFAAGAGRVSYAGMIAGRGVLVVVHGTLRTTYEPVSALVAVDEPVLAGEVIGLLDAGHEGCPVSACLHWGLKRGEDYLDPVALVDRPPSRLLPLGDAGGLNRVGPRPLVFARAGPARGVVVGAAVGASLAGNGW